MSPRQAHVSELSLPPPASPVVSNQNAVRSAQQYLAVSGFPRSGLIEQVTYDGYTGGQPAPGADAAGL